MAVMIAAPIIWLSGGTIMQMTAHARLTSPLYLASLVCLAVAFVLSRQESVAQKRFLSCCLLAYS